MQQILSDLFIEPLFDKSAVSANFTIPQGCSECSWQVLSDRDIIAEGSSELPSGQPAKIFEQMPGFTPWTLENPHLYKMRLTLKINGRLYEISQHFGMRKIEVKGKWIYLNNQKIYLRGYIRGREAHDHPNMLNLDLYTYHEKNIKQAKKFGFNLVRFHSRIPDQTFLEAADKLGILVHVELRKYFGKYQKERRMMSDEGEILDKQQWIETVKKLRNHCCVMAYCMGNEIRKPGRNPFVREIADLTKEIDPTRLFIDTCAHGEYDRDYVDFDVQHMSYYFPYGKNYDMFDNTYNWHIYGSVDENKELLKEAGNYTIRRALNIDRPVLAHEICHYIALHDIYNLDKKFTSNNIEKPWWVDELKKLVETKGLEEDYPQMYKASKEFQKTCWKLGIEAARRSKLLSGFHFLQLCDTDLYENSNGLIDCFDDNRYVESSFFKQFNGNTAILADLPKRTFFELDEVKIPVAVSHFDQKLKPDAVFEFELADESGKAILSDSMADIDMSKLGLQEICTLTLKIPELEKAQNLKLKLKLSWPGNETVANHWDLWAFPNEPQTIENIKCRVDLDDIDLSRRYSDICKGGNDSLIIKNRFDDELFDHLAEGKDALLLYRVEETRSREAEIKREKYYLPATWDRYKGIIWDRGTFSGGFLRKHFISNRFPNNGFLDLQFHDLVDDCDKINFDTFPVKIDPAIQGVDKAVRDRFDVYTYQLSELQPEWTLRKFGYLAEIKVGSGRLFISAFNFTGIEKHDPAVCYMFETIIKYVTSEEFNPQASIGLDMLKDYLLEQGQKPRICERKMTQFWQLNNMPLESDKYWAEAEQFIEKNQTI
ncbi:MAG: glycoside hydrolase family 2 TIM barrel-domain containing protein [Sedimentisphaeraceae bacterium JB056]